MEYNISFLVAALVFLLLQLYHFLLQRRLEDINNRIFQFFLCTGIIDISLDILCTLLVQSQKTEYAEITRILLTLFYLMQVMIPYAFMCYVISLRDGTVVHMRYIMRRWMAPALIMTILVITNYWSGILFSVDENCQYIHGVGYMWMFYYVFIYVVCAFINSLTHYKEIGWRKVGIICEFLVAASICVAVQIFNDELLMTGFGIAVGISILFLTIHNPYGEMDNLTGALDKQYFEKWIQEKMKRGKKLNLISVDLFQLKRINKFWGTKIGDKLLIQVSKELQKIGDSIHVFRIGSKRFVLVLETLDAYERARENLKRFFEQDFCVNGEKIEFPAIICGIMDVQKWKESDKLIAYMEYLVAMAANSSGSTLIQGNEATYQGFSYEQEVERFLDIAIEEDLFEVYYQPVYDIESGKYITLEALSRLRHPSLGNISPDIFITIAERNGQITKIGQLQFRKVCKFVKNHPELMRILRNVKFNLSPSELMNPGYCRALIGIIQEFELPFSFFQFEITETVATEYSEMLNQVIEDFNKAGIGLCLDDFGAGYANLDTVLKLPFVCIKIDRSLLNGICEDKQAARFYHSIVSVMQNMGYYVVAEGVETSEEVTLLTSWNVNMIQGYYYSKPLCESDLLKKLKE